MTAHDSDVARILKSRRAGKTYEMRRRLALDALAREARGEPARNVVWYDEAGEIDRAKWADPPKAPRK